MDHTQQSSNGSSTDNAPDDVGTDSGNENDAYLEPDKQTEQQTLLN